MKKSSRVNILVCGLLWSGSGAVKDLLREYLRIGVIPNEFDDFRYSGLIGDYLCERICDDYPSKVKEYFTVRLFGKRGILHPRVFLKKILFITPFIKIFPEHMKLWKRFQLTVSLEAKLLSNISKNEKIECASNWLQACGDLYACNHDFLLMDQPLQYNCHEGVWPLVFDPFKLIIVYRNPLDQIAQIIKQGLLFGEMKMELPSLHKQEPIISIYGGGRKGAINFQIDALSARLMHAENMLKSYGPDHVLLISFEKLVEKYNYTKKIIEEFIGITENDHINELKFFNPDISNKNIGIYQNYLNSDEIKRMSGLLKKYRDLEERNPCYV